MKSTPAWSQLFLFDFFIVFSLIDFCNSHGRLLEPPQRGSMWRFGFEVPANYNDMSNYCGGKENQWTSQNGRCGLCGDPFQGPRDHEDGGIYATGIIGRTYESGEMINTTIDITANHFGYFEFRLCPLNMGHSRRPRRLTQHCLDEYLLKIGPNLMQLILLSTILLTMIFSLINAGMLLHVEQPTFETRVKHAETILFGRFNWAIPISNNDHLNDVYSNKQNTFEFIVYCTIKKSKAPDNVSRYIRVTIEHNETEIDMRKNRWFILFPTKSDVNNIWIIHNRSDAFDLEDDLEFRIFEQFCFLKPKLPYGFPNSGLLNRCPKPSAEHCLKNGTRIRHDELLELKTFLTSTTTRKPKLIKSKRIIRSKPIIKQKRFIEPVW
ncbi:unnamed protein product [Adineta steineri]|uniref:Chitin-binding type-4 domain-containing protein n=1 Tax=Adineta steineri TaxID=433720 RepID=A0A813TMF2_9BILA|nr:unnamed protein product [Adineta steineri]